MSAQSSIGPIGPIKRIGPTRAIFSALFALIGLGVFLWPGIQLTRSIFDPALNGKGIPKLARQLHYSLTPRYARWATERIGSPKATKVSISNVSGTEWPLYGSVFYLWAEETLQAEWERDHSLFAEEPRVFARNAIDAAVRVVADPAHATWVKKYWGDKYLERENVFYRMLLISALASHRRLTGSDEFVTLLRSQTDGLAAELSASRFGLLDDYPSQCYPTDVISAWEAIRRADIALGTDHSAQIAQGLRGFTGDRVGSFGLPAYFADARTGQPADGSRGCSNSNACMLAPTLWPEIAPVWYATYEKHFWQRDWLAAGFREIPRGAKGSEWFFDVDAGPVIRGNGFAACAFGVAAARRNGRFDHAYPLSLEMIALSWPFPVGRLIVPELVSDSEHAPLLGEAGILFQLTSQPIFPTLRHHTGGIPAIVLFCLAFYLGMGTLFLISAWRIATGRAKGRRPGVPPLRGDHIPAQRPTV